MATPLLVIGNKRYSSWSLRAWMGLREAGIPFREHRIPLYLPGSREEILTFSPAGRVPVLVDGDLTVWESIAILEHVNAAYAGGALLPADAAERARARAVCAEMHAGFPHLRETLPMNLGRPVAALPLDGETGEEVARILSLWEGLLERHADAGPFLFGTWGLADCMYLPVVTRFRHYGVELSAHPRAAAYVERMYGLPSFGEWLEAGLAETETIPGISWP